MDAYDREHGEGSSETSGTPDASEGGNSGDFGEDTLVEPFDGDPARGLAITRVVANQGVSTTLGVDGRPTSAREAVIVADRRMLIEAHVHREPSFVPREILGRLRLRYPDGRSRVLETTVDVEESSQESRPFQWVVEPGDVRVGTRYDIELYELSADGEPGEPPRFPLAGTDDLGIFASPPTLEVVLVPYRHILGGCDQTAPHDEAMVNALRKTALEKFPVRDVHITVHEVETFTEPSGGLGNFLDTVTSLREQEDPSPSVFYYGMLHPCDTPTAGGKGWMPQGAEELSDPNFRASVGLYNEIDPHYQLRSTFVHELSHNMGRTHVACSGAEGSVDPAYPHPGGDIGGIGWSIADGDFVSPDSKDFMTYCKDQELWQSDYGWNLSHVLLGQIAQQHDASGAPSSSAWVLRVIEEPDGTVHTRVAPGRVVTPSGLALEAVSHDGRRHRLVGREENVPDSSDRIYSFELPQHVLPELTRLEWSQHDRPVVIGAGDIHGLADARQTKTLRPATSPQ